MLLADVLGGVCKNSARGKFRRSTRTGIIWGHTHVGDLGAHYDTGTHISGLVAAGVIESPFELADRGCGRGVG